MFAALVAMITIPKEENAAIEWETRISAQPDAELKIGELVDNLKLKGQLSPPKLA